jgi:hypothetical protein
MLMAVCICIKTKGLYSISKVRFILIDHLFVKHNMDLLRGILFNPCHSVVAWGARMLPS